MGRFPTAIQPGEQKTAGSRQIAAHHGAISDSDPAPQTAGSLQLAAGRTHGKRTGPPQRGDRRRQESTATHPCKSKRRLSEKRIGIGCGHLSSQFWLSQVSAKRGDSILGPGAGKGPEPPINHRLRRFERNRSLGETTPRPRARRRGRSIWIRNGQAAPSGIGMGEGAEEVVRFVSKRGTDGKSH